MVQTGNWMKHPIIKNPGKSACRHLTKPIQLFILLSHAAVGSEGGTERWPFYLLKSVLSMLNGICILLIAILLQYCFLCLISQTFHLISTSARNWDTSLLMTSPASVQVSHLDSKDNDIWHRNVAFWAVFSTGWDPPCDNRERSPEQWLASFAGWDAQVGSLFPAERYWFVSLQECTACLQSNCCSG